MIDWESRLNPLNLKDYFLGPKFRLSWTPVGVGINVCEWEFRLVNYMRVKYCEKEVRKKVLLIVLYFRGRAPGLSL